MGLPVAVAILSVAIGAALGLYRSAGALLAPIRTFAVVSATAVVLVQLLPDALAGLGLWAVLVLVASALLPGALDRVISRRARGAGHRVGLEIGYAGLLLHQAGDGLGLAAYSGGAHAGHHHGDVLVAIGAHTIPITALVVMGFASSADRKAGVLRAIGLAAGTLAGIALVGVVPEHVVEHAMPWLAAIVGGLLLHVVSHDFHPGAAPRGRRGLDLVALGLGLGVAFLAGSGHSHGDSSELRERTLDAFVDLTFETAPALVLGLAIGAVLQTYSSKLPTKWLASGSALQQAVRGALVGAPLPLCACGVLPVAASLRARGAGAALVVAFLLATPELGVETFALTVQFLGWELAGLRLFSAVAVAIVAALVVAWATSRSLSGEGASGPSRPPLGPVPEGSALRRAFESFEELLHHVGPFTLAGLFVAAFVSACVTEGSLDGMRSFGLDVLVATLVAVPSYVCAASATPLAAVLLAKGLSPGAVLAGLLLGPATNVATIGFLRTSFGGRATALGLAALLGLVWIFAFATNALPIDFIALVPASATGEDHEHGVIAIGGVVVLAALALRGVARMGLARWMSSLGEALGAGHSHGEEEEEGTDGHGHGHGHGIGGGHGIGHGDGHGHGHGHED